MPHPTASEPPASQIESLIGKDVYLRAIRAVEGGSQVRLPGHIDGDKGRPAWSDFRVAHSLLADEDNLVSEANGKDGLQVGSRRPVQVLYPFVRTGQTLSHQPEADLGTHA